MARMLSEILSVIADTARADGKTVSSRVHGLFVFLHSHGSIKSRATGQKAREIAPATDAREFARDPRVSIYL